MGLDISSYRGLRRSPSRAPSRTPSHCPGHARVLHGEAGDGDPPWSRRRSDVSNRRRETPRPLPEQPLLRGLRAKAAR